MSVKMWGEVTHAPYGKISIEIWRGGIGDFHVKENRTCFKKWNRNESMHKM